MTRICRKKPGRKSPTRTPKKWTDNYCKYGLKSPSPTKQTRKISLKKKVGRKKVGSKRKVVQSRSSSPSRKTLRRSGSKRKTLRRSSSKSRSSSPSRKTLRRYGSKRKVVLKSRSSSPKSKTCKRKPGPKSIHRNTKSFRGKCRYGRKLSVKK